MGGYLMQSYNGFLNVLVPWYDTGSLTKPAMVELQHWQLEPPPLGTSWTQGNGGKRIMTSIQGIPVGCYGGALIQDTFPPGPANFEALLYGPPYQYAETTYLQHWWRDNSWGGGLNPDTAWIQGDPNLANQYPDLGVIADVPASIQSTFHGSRFEALACIRNQTGGLTDLKHWFRDSSPQTPDTWFQGYGGQSIVHDAHGVALIQSTFGSVGIGNFEALVHVGNNDLQHWWRDNGGPNPDTSPWIQGNGGKPIIKGVDSARRPALIQSNFQGSSNAPGNFEALVSVQNGLQHWWRDNSKQNFPWTQGNGGRPIVTGLAGSPALIQAWGGGVWGDKGNFIVVVPVQDQTGYRLQYWIRDNDATDVDTAWSLAFPQPPVTVGTWDFPP